jgi:hypothetical protein
MEITVKARGTKRLNLKYDDLRSSFAFEFHRAPLKPGAVHPQADGGAGDQE